MSTSCHFEGSIEMQHEMLLSLNERSGPKGSPVSVKRETDLHRPEASVDPERTVVVSVLIIIFVHVFIGESCYLVFAEFENRFKITNTQVERESRRVRMGKAAAQSPG